MLSELTNHLWQSTIFALAAGLITVAFRQNRAQVRYWLWFSGSCKFLIPLSLLMSLGSRFEWAQISRKMAAAPAVRFTLVQISQPFPSALPLASATRATHDWALIALFGVWACGFAAIALMRFRGWRRIRAAVRSSTPLHIPATIEIRSSPGLLEPGVVGLFRPILLLPDGIVQLLAARQLEPVLAHELCHVRRRDNLTSAVHMIVEAVFWFHPLVWWIGARLMEERERACDEAVLGLGNEPHDYAEGILNVCKSYLESPLSCVSGVTGSDLKRRIQAILTGRVARDLTFAKKLALAVAGMGALAVPIAVGIISAPRIRAQSQPVTPLAFEVASIRPNKSYSLRFAGIEFLPGGRFRAGNMYLQAIIATAYNVPVQSSQLVGGPNWIRFERYDIEAIAEKDAIPIGAPATLRDERLRLMLQTLLADRFKLTIRREMKEQSVYALTVAKGGPKLQKATIEERDCPEVYAGDRVSCHFFTGGQGRGIHGLAVSMLDVVQHVANWTDRPVVDRTGLQGLFNIQTDGWVSMRPRLRPPGAEPTAEDLAFFDPTRPTLFMIFERLGLKLEPQKAPVETFVIEHVERPSEN